jgi:tRNA (adenine-N(1)-)-methyltransferase non-catalytic subunit
MERSPNATNNTIETRDPYIQPGNTILLRVPNGDVRSAKIDKDSYGSAFLSAPLPLYYPRTVTLGRLGSFYANELLFQPYGLHYDISEKKLKVIPPRTLQELGTELPSYWKL